jgi:anti-sigma-28 factor FlgM
MVNPEKPAVAKRRKAAPPALAPTPPAGTGPEGAADEARRKRIADIKKSLEDGTYHVSNEDVARKLIEHMLEPKK